MEPVKGVHQIRIPLPNMPLDHINVYLVEGSKGNVLIDTGWDTLEAFSALKDGLRSSGFGFKDISQIIVTHIHPDHYGLAGKLRQLSGATVAFHEIEEGLLDLRYVNMDKLVEDTKHRLSRNGVPRSEVSRLAGASLPVRQYVDLISPDIRLTGGERLSFGSSEFKVLVTPGHSPGHICLYEPNRKFLFSGDQVLPDITPHVGLHAQSGENPLGDFVDSLKSLRELDVNLVFPGHGAVFNGLKQRIDAILYHHDQRKLAIMNIIRDNLRSAYAIAAELVWVPDIGGVDFKDLAPMDKRLAVLETLAHLQLLVNEDKVQSVVDKDTVLYWAGG